MVRGIALAVLASLCGCLESPPGTSPPPPAAADAAPGEPDGGQPLDAAAPRCGTAFAVVYVDRLTAATSGGSYQGVAVIEAIGDAVNLDFLGEGPDDSSQVELELTEVAFEVTAPGTARGALDPTAEELVLAQGLLDPGSWDDSAPTFALALASLPDSPPTHRLQAPVFVGDSVALLEFELTYDDEQVQAGIANRVTRVFSSCPE